ncbi:MAG: hypothetical protein WC428_00145 [Candidatus Paceibacterota bacterium]
MQIEKKYWDIWDKTTFKTICYHKNFDLVNDDESLITEYRGTISLIRVKEYKPPVLMGEFELSEWNIGLGLKFDADLMKLMKKHKAEFLYTELLSVIKNKEIDITKYKKIVFVTNLIVRPDFRKFGLTEEFVELLYREHFNENDAIIALVKPLQDNKIDKDHYYKREIIEIKLSLEDNKKLEFVPAVEYYKLNELLERKDTETNEYKLFSIATKCGFSRIGESYLFNYSPEKTIQRMSEKRNYSIKINSFI